MATYQLNNGCWIAWNVDDRDSFTTTATKCVWTTSSGEHGEREAMHHYSLFGNEDPKKDHISHYRGHREDLEHRGSCWEWTTCLEAAARCKEADGKKGRKQQGRHNSPTLCRKYGIASSFVTKVLKKEVVKCYKGQKGPKSSPELVSPPKKCCRAMVRNHCKPSSQTELVLRKDIPQNVPQLAQSKICGLHLRRPCTVVAGRPKTRSRWREERKSVRELDWDVVRTMMVKVKTRLRNAVDKSPLSLLKFTWTHLELSRTIPIC